MVEVFANKLDWEILADLEGNMNDTSSMTEEELEQQKRNYPLFRYLFEQEDIPTLCEGEYGLCVGDQVIRNTEKKSRTSNNKYIIPTANKILVEKRENKKDPKDFPELANAMKKLGRPFDYVQDIEFFESYLDQRRLAESLLRGFDKNKTGMGWVKQQVRSLNGRDFEEAMSFVSDYSIVDLMDVLEEEKADKRQFTAFLDTEKIHLQLVQSNNEQILVYFGYGNHNAFTRNLPGKGQHLARASRIDHIRDPDSTFLKSQFAQPTHIRRHNLKELININQQNYEQYFLNNIGYDSRLASFQGEHNSAAIDQILMIPPRIRTKSAALIAYNRL